MDLSRTMKDALIERPELAGIACIDLQSGMVVSAALKDDTVEEGIEAAAACASELCSTPHAPADETFLVGEQWMHVLVRAPSRPELVVVGVAPAAANLGLLMSCTRVVARRLPTLSP